MKEQHSIDQTIQANLQQFKKIGALTVRPGYKITNGWITRKPSIVVTVRVKRAKVSAKQMIPPKIGRYQTDVREATSWQKLRHEDPAQYGSLLAFDRPEYAQPEFPYERDAQSGQLLNAAITQASLTLKEAKPKVPYRPPGGATLDPVSDTFTITICASPDAGWKELSQFLTGIDKELIVGMYDFTSAHVLDAVKVALNSKQTLSLVLDHPSLNATADQSDEQTEAALSKELGGRQAFAWAAEAHDPMVSKSIFPSAYHIKVAVKDRRQFWLSSGNWNNSNQPDLGPGDPNQNHARVDPIAKNSDRDWHAIVDHPGLASTFAAYLENDLVSASKLQAGRSDAKASFASLEGVTSKNPEKEQKGLKAPKKYFPAKTITDRMTIQPVLTPDAGTGNYVQNLSKLINSAKKSVYIQLQYIHPADPSKAPGMEVLIDALKSKIAAKLDVKIILSQWEATASWLELLQSAGIDVSSYVRIQHGVHNKGFVIDGRVVALGSQNWSGDGVELNRDATLIIYHSDVAAYFSEIFLSDWSTLAERRLSTGA